MSNKLSYLLIFIPWFLFLFTFTVGLAIFNVYISFTDWQGILPSFNIIGFQNYLELPSTGGFLENLINTGVLFVVGLPIAVFVSLLIAVTMDILNPKIAYFFRTIAIISMALGGVVVALLWSWMFQYQYGGINQLLRAVGLGFLTMDWIGTPSLIMYSVILMLVWKFSGYGGLIILGGLQGVPKNSIESAKIDGATTFQIYKYVLLPQVKGHVLVITMLLSMYLLKSFDYIWPLTGGGPGWSSTIFPVLVYRQMFEARNFAGGAAVATLMLVFVSILVILFIKLSRVDDNND